MGNPLHSDDIGKMCFNPAKTFYMNTKGWYQEGTCIELYKCNYSWWHIAMTAIYISNRKDSFIHSYNINVLFHDCINQYKLFDFSYLYLLHKFNGSWLSPSVEYNKAYIRILIYICVWLKILFVFYVSTPSASIKLIQSIQVHKRNPMKSDEIQRNPMKSNEIL